MELSISCANVITDLWMEILIWKIIIHREQTGDRLGKNNDFFFLFVKSLNMKGGGDDELIICFTGQNRKPSSEIEMMADAVLTEGSELPWFQRKRTHK